MIDTTLDDRKRAEIDQPPKAIAADARYGNQQQLDKDAADNLAQPLRTNRHLANLCLRTGTHVHDVSGERRHQIRQRASVASQWMGLSHSSSGRFSAYYRVGDGAATRRRLRTRWGP